MKFGFYRYLLSAFVIVSHIFPWLSSQAGSFAVFGFYIISGYLMTFILDKNYGWDNGGIRRYYLNRVLRVFPTYLIILILSFLAIFLFPEIYKQLNKAMIIPSSTKDYLSNLFIIGLGPGLPEKIMNDCRLIPPAWALHVELIFYMLIPFIARNYRSVLIWFCISLAYTLVLSTQEFNFYYNYFSLFAASLPFSTGALLHYVLKNNPIEIKKKNSYILLVAGLILILLNLFLARNFNHLTKWTFYTNYILQIGIIALLISTSQNFNFISKKFDKILGDLSYPNYLIHWLVAGIICLVLYNGVIPPQQSENNSELFLYTLLFANIFSFIIIFSIEKLVEKRRDKIRRYPLTQTSS